jgi:hypothetical protein
MRNEVHVEFHETVHTLIGTTTPAALNIVPQYSVYTTAYGKEVSLLDIVRKSEYTEEIWEQDHKRDTIYRGLADAIKSALNHFNANKSKAAEQLDLIFQSYGNIAQKPLDEATAAIDDLLRELGYDRDAVTPSANNAGTPMAAIMTLGLLDWLDELYTDNQQLKTLMEARYNEIAHRPGEQMRHARTEVDKAYHDIVAHIEALILIQGESAYADFVDQLNAIVARYKHILAQQAGARKAKQ